MAESAVLDLQRKLVDFALAVDTGEASEGLQTYRELIRLSLSDPIEDMFPICKAMLGEAWEPCLSAFLAARCIPSPHYRDVAPAFLGWLAETGYGQEQWPSLLQLAHYELLETFVDQHPEGSLPSDLTHEPSRGHRLVLDPATQVVAYDYSVHLATEDQPFPPAVPVAFLVYRDANEDVHGLELTPATAALLTRAQHSSLSIACQDLGLGLDKALPLLRDLRAQGAVAGFLP